MDTRDKIISSGELRLNGRPRRIILGYFDPYWAAHARRLEELCSPDYQNVVVIDSTADCLTEERGRAEVVAALACVDYVLLRADELPTEPAELIDERPADLLRRDELAARVRMRHGAQ